RRGVGTGLRRAADAGRAVRRPTRVVLGSARVPRRELLGAGQAGARRPPAPRLVLWQRRQPRARRRGRAGNLSHSLLPTWRADPRWEGGHRRRAAAGFAAQRARRVQPRPRRRVPGSCAAGLALVIESSRPPVYLPYRSGDIESAIASHAAKYIPDRAVLECGIGNVPNAVLGALGERRGLRFHSGLIPDGVAALHAKGALTGEIHGGCLMGTQELFDWARENPQVRLHSSDYTHGATVLAKLERFVAINSAVEVDLTGQVNAELARGSYVGAVGGALDFIRAAN